MLNALSRDPRDAPSLFERWPGQELSRRDPAHAKRIGRRCKSRCRSRCATAAYSLARCRRAGEPASRRYRSRVGSYSCERAIPVGVSTGWWIAPRGRARQQLIRAWQVLPDYVSINLIEEDAAEIIDVVLGKGVGVEAGLWSPRDAE